MTDINKEIKRQKIRLEQAKKKQNVTSEELFNLQEKLELLETMKEKMENDKL